MLLIKFIKWVTEKLKDLLKYFACIGELVEQRILFFH
jgi:hypothetical protein